MSVREETTVREDEETTAMVIAGLREHIDHVDAEIRALIARRRSLSRQVQRARIAGGGRRTDFSREMRVTSPYTEAFGRQGTTIALALLEIGRGAGTGQGPGLDEAA
ncbi:chorismate mutase [Streptomyces sp. CA-253872]|uniref:chorismate mutase n=1 Tax=Streptomyces sp. CA-253872 TaxID=3240067 RepID=UPI003D8A9723